MATSPDMTPKTAELIFARLLEEAEKYKILLNAQHILGIFAPLSLTQSELKSMTPRTVGILTPIHDDQNHRDLFHIKQVPNVYHAKTIKDQSMGNRADWQDISRQMRISLRSHPELIYTEESGRTVISLLADLMTHLEDSR